MQRPLQEARTPNRKAMVKLAEKTVAEFKVLSKEGDAMYAEAVQQAQQSGAPSDASSTVPGMVTDEDGLLGFSGVADEPMEPEEMDKALTDTSRSVNDQTLATVFCHLFGAVEVAMQQAAAAGEGDPVAIVGRMQAMPLEEIVKQTQDMQSQPASSSSGAAPSGAAPSGASASSTAAPEQ